jgi:hypothetical protein
VDEGASNQHRPEKGKQHSSPSRLRRDSGRIDGAPLGAKIAGALILAILASLIFVRAYLAERIGNSRRALLYLGSLILFGLAFGLWMSGAPQ